MSFEAGLRFAQLCAKVLVVVREKLAGSVIVAVRAHRKDVLVVRKQRGILFPSSPMVPRNKGQCYVVPMLASRSQHLLKIERTVPRSQQWIVDDHGSRRASHMPTPLSKGG